MRVGVAGFLPNDPAAIDRAAADALRAMGMSGASVILPDPTAYAEAELARVRQCLAASGIAVAQVNPRYHSLIGPEEVRRAGLAALRAACRCARWLQAANVYVRPGSLNPRGPWLSHPRNTSPEALEQLVDSLKEAASVAEGEGVVLALEGHVLSPLDSPTRVREVLDAVGSDSLRFNSDPVNFVGTLADAYDTRGLIDRLFAELGDRTVCAHLKDVYVEERLVLHLAECAPGDGLLDLPAFLTGFERCCPNGYVLIEHLPPDRVPAAKRALDVVLSRAGLRWS
jgi:sugar phosphate isomerase/epimerase